MKFAVFACLLVVAGVSALPQDVAPSQERLVDKWLVDRLSIFRDFIINNGLEPFIIEHWDLDYVLIDGLVELLGELVDVKLEGLSGIYWNFVHYNILLGRLDWDLVMPRISLSVGKFEAEGLYGDRGGKVTLSGRLVIENIRIKGNALLRLDPGPVVTIYNINADSSIASIEADVKATWQCRDCEESDDVSDKLNTFLNETLLQLLERFKKEIDTIVAEAIRYLVNYVWQ